LPTRPVTPFACPGDPRVVLATAGSHGDLHPFVGLALAVRARGARTTLMVPAAHAARAAAALGEGIEVVPLGRPDDYERALRDPAVWRMREGFGRIWASGDAAFRDALAWLDALPDDGPTTLVAHPLVLAHASIARARRRTLRVVAAWLAPSNLVTVHDPLTLGPLAVPRWWPAAARRAAWALGERVAFIESGDLQALVDQAAGVVTVNSTVGTMGLQAGRPVIALGKALYRLPGLCFDGPLAAFWREASPPDSALVSSFEQVVMHATQVNGGLYGRAAIELGLARVVDRLLNPISALERLLEGGA
ncbi:MAG: hypothetical protein WCK28_23750, partial [Burkholderiales bacterium]